jgi:hypothetical protein
MSDNKEATFQAILFIHRPLTNSLNVETMSIHLPIAL